MGEQTSLKSFWIQFPISEIITPLSVYDSTETTYTTEPITVGKEAVEHFSGQIKGGQEKDTAEAGIDAHITIAYVGKLTDAQCSELCGDYVLMNSLWRFTEKQLFASGLRLGKVGDEKGYIALILKFEDEYRFERSSELFRSRDKFIQGIRNIKAVKDYYNESFPEVSTREWLPHISLLEFDNMTERDSLFTELSVGGGGIAKNGLANIPSWTILRGNVRIQLGEPEIVIKSKDGPKITEKLSSCIDILTQSSFQ